MKKDTHPEYNFVVLEDSSANYRFLTRSTMKVDATKTTVWEDGETYPVVQLEISNASHPFFTGQMKIIDSAGRVERFNKRYGTRKKAVAKKEPAAKKQALFADYFSESIIDWIPATVVRGFTMHKRKTVSPFQLLGTTNASPRSKILSLHC